MGVVKNGHALFKKGVFVLLTRLFVSFSLFLVQSMSSLPDTVTVLDCPNGSKVYLVGTAHFSKESAIDVQKTIQQVR